MSNAAIYLHPGGYDTSGQRLLGRHSAGESFLRGYLRHAQVDGYYFWNVANRPRSELEALLQRLQPPNKPVHWIERNARPSLGQVGVLNMPTPELPVEAWNRRFHGERTYAICGITHTTATDNVMRLLSDMFVAPVQGYDALICTSSAVRASVESQLDDVRAYMAAEYGPRRRPEPMRVTIPLGVNVDDFATSEADRKSWREKLNIPEDAVVALYVGRFNVRGKMNPALMAMALERAARRTGRRLYWVNSGWAETPSAEEIYHRETSKLCPSVEYIHVDGRPADVRFSIWSVADFFISFSDNIQETFGLTPVEAMAAGLPCVVSDWNGYKDTVREGEDGFRIPTLAPRPGYGRDLAYWYFNGWIDYETYVGATGQYMAVDMAAAEGAIARLVLDADLRRELGARARQHARQVFDWSAVIPQYQALWAEQNARRRAAPERAPADHPGRPDPFRLFANYPTRHITREDLVTLSPATDPADAAARLAAPLAVYGQFYRPNEQEVSAVLDLLSARGLATVAELLEPFPAGRRSYIERGLLWLARHDIIAIRPPA